MIVDKADLQNVNGGPFKDTSAYCCYCGRRFKFNLEQRCTADHLIPLSRGGNNTYFNKRNCCSKCNTEKCNLYLEDWLHKVKNSRLNEYDKGIKVENIKYILHYVRTSKQKVFKNLEHYKGYINSIAYKSAN